MPASINILSSMAPRKFLESACVAYEKQTGTRISVTSAGGVDVMERIERGEAASLVVLAREFMDKLANDGKVLAASRVDLVASAIAVAVRTGARRPNIDNEEALKHAMLSAVSIGYSTGPSGRHVEDLFKRWRILASIRERLVVSRSGIPVAHLVATGEVELGLQQLSELISVPHVEVVGELPASCQAITVFTGALSTSCMDTGAVAFLDFAASATTDSLKRQHGLIDARADERANR